MEGSIYIIRFRYLGSYDWKLNLTLGFRAILEREYDSVWMHRAVVDDGVPQVGVKGLQRLVMLSERGYKLTDLLFARRAVYSVIPELLDAFAGFLEGVAQLLVSSQVLLRHDLLRGSLPHEDSQFGFSLIVFGLQPFDEGVDFVGLHDRRYNTFHCMDQGSLLIEDAARGVDECLLYDALIKVRRGAGISAFFFILTVTPTDHLAVLGVRMPHLAAERAAAVGTVSMLYRSSR